MAGQTRELPQGEGLPDASGKRAHTAAQVFRLLGRDRRRAVDFLCRVYLRLDAARGAGLFPGHGAEDLDRR
ncbi:MAG TPA: hypothetical protein VKE74_04015, partial [Gemmataceae bacterium]|nr:hypothetical protein [Gemmataceae bacterium]